MVNILVDKMLSGRYLVNFVLVDIYYNPTGRSDGVEIGREEDVADPQ